jgi:hypothetical protein
MRLSIYASPIRLEASAAKFQTILTQHQTRRYNSIAKKQFTGLRSRIRGVEQFRSGTVGDLSLYLLTNDVLRMKV